jgi:hypothetical protein
MKVVTLVTNSNHPVYANCLKATADFHDLDLVTFTPQRYSGHRLKDETLYQYLKTLHDEEIVFYTDGYDTFFVSGEDEILSKFFKTGKNLLFSAEFTCMPDARLALKYPSVKSPFKYLNSGGFIGKAWYIRRRLEDNLETESTTKFKWSNQVYWAEQYLKNPSEIGLDVGCDIFGTFASDADVGIVEIIRSKEFDRIKYNEAKLKWFEETFRIENGRIFVIPTRSKPCHLHFPGPTSVLLTEVASRLYPEENE